VQQRVACFYLGRSEKCDVSSPNNNFAMRLVRVFEAICEVYIANNIYIGAFDAEEFSISHVAEGRISRILSWVDARELRMRKVEVRAH